MKIDKRKTYLCGLDTETCNGYIGVDGKLCLDDSLVYDIGYQIVDKKGNVYLKRSFIVAETFIGEKNLMKSAYYAEKIPRYNRDYKEGKREIRSILTIKKQLQEDMKKFNCKIVFAHNARFDDRALKNTVRYITKSKVRYFLPYGTEIWDTLKMATDIFGKRKTYQEFCITNNFMTKHRPPRARFTAEILYRYITNNINFIESHTGLEDVEIETEILVACFKAHKKMRKKLYENNYYSQPIII